tara:strand:- start:6849 stop:7502 length:654 start_codon:yes stop_codon:yes gene_type:complete
MYREGTTPNTRAVVSSKNKIFAPRAAQGQMGQVGVMTSFSISESRAVDPIRAVGFGDTVAEQVPSATEPFSISVERTMLYLANAFQQFGYHGGIDGMVRSLKHHRWPFDIKQEIVFSELVNAEFPNTAHEGPSTLPLASSPSYDGSGIYALVTLFEGCWMTSYSTDFASEGTAVAESVEIVCTDVLDPNIDGTYGEFIDSGNNPFIVGQLGSQRFAS